MLAARPSRILPLALAAALCFSTAPARADDPGSRWIAALPFGMGQLQNGDVGLGVFFAVGEVVLAGASIATYMMVGSLASTDVGPGAHQPVDLTAINARIRTAAAVNRAAFAGWATLTAVGVFEAEVRFAPRRAARRPLSPSITATPVVGGGLVGVRASF